MRHKSIRPSPYRKRLGEDPSIKLPYEPTTEGLFAGTKAAPGYEEPAAPEPPEPPEEPKATEPPAKVETPKVRKSPAAPRPKQAAPAPAKPAPPARGVPEGEAPPAPAKAPTTPTAAPKRPAVPPPPARREEREQPKAKPAVNFVTESSGGQIRRDVTIGDKVAGSSEIIPENPGQRRAVLRMMPDLEAKAPGAKLHRLQGIHLEDEFRGQGVGQRMMIDALAQNPDDWLWNSQLSKPATEMLRRLEAKGDVEVYTPGRRGDGSVLGVDNQAFQPSEDDWNGMGTFAVRLTDKGKREALGGGEPAAAQTPEEPELYKPPLKPKRERLPTVKDNALAIADEMDAPAAVLPIRTKDGGMVIRVTDPHPGAGPDDFRERWEVAAGARGIDPSGVSVEPGDEEDSYNVTIPKDEITPEPPRSIKELRKEFFGLDESVLAKVIPAGVKNPAFRNPTLPGLEPGVEVKSRSPSDHRYIYAVSYAGANDKSGSPVYGSILMRDDGVLVDSKEELPHGYYTDFVYKKIPDDLYHLLDEAKRKTEEVEADEYGHPHEHDPVQIGDAVRSRYGDKRIWYIAGMFEDPNGPQYVVTDAAGNVDIISEAGSQQVRDHAAEFRRENGDWAIPDGPRWLDQEAEGLGLDPDLVADKLQNAPLVELTPEMWDGLANSDSYGTLSMDEAREEGDPGRVDRVEYNYREGAPVVAPVVAIGPDGVPYLLDGEDELLAARALGMTPRVQIVDLRPDEEAREHPAYPATYEGSTKPTLGEAVNLVTSTPPEGLADAADRLSLLSPDELRDLKESLAGEVDPEPAPNKTPKTTPPKIKPSPAAPAQRNPVPKKPPAAGGVGVRDVPPAPAPERPSAATSPPEEVAREPERPAEPVRPKPKRGGVEDTVLKEQEAGKWPQGELSDEEVSVANLIDLRNIEETEKLRPTVEHLRDGGDLPPVVVTRGPDGRMKVIQGEDSLKASALAGRGKVSAVVIHEREVPQEENGQVKSSSKSAKSPWFSGRGVVVPVRHGSEVAVPERDRERTADALRRYGFWYEGIGEGGEKGEGAEREFAKKLGVPNAVNNGSYDDEVRLRGWAGYPLFSNLDGDPELARKLSELPGDTVRDVLVEAMVNGIGTFQGEKLSIEQADSLVGIVEESGVSLDVPRGNISEVLKSGEEIMWSGEHSDRSGYSPLGEYAYQANKTRRANMIKLAGRGFLLFAGEDHLPALREEHPPAEAPRRRKTVETLKFFDLPKLREDLEGIVVPFDILDGDSDKGTYEVSQDEVEPVGGHRDEDDEGEQVVDDETYDGLRNLVRESWDRGYVFFDFHPQNVAWTDDGLKVLDLNAFKERERSKVPSAERLLHHLAEWYGREDRDYKELTTYAGSTKPTADEALSLVVDSTPAGFADAADRLSLLSSAELQELKTSLADVDPDQVRRVVEAATVDAGGPFPKTQRKPSVHDRETVQKVLDLLRPLENRDMEMGEGGQVSPEDLVEAVSLAASTSKAAYEEAWEEMVSRFGDESVRKAAELADVPPATKTSRAAQKFDDLIARIQEGNATPEQIAALVVEAWHLPSQTKIQDALAEIRGTYGEEAYRSAHGEAMKIEARKAELQSKSHNAFRELETFNPYDSEHERNAFYRAYLDLDPEVFDLFSKRAVAKYGESRVREWTEFAEREKSVQDDSAKAREEFVTRQIHYGLRGVEEVVGRGELAGPAEMSDVGVSNYSVMDPQTWSRFRDALAEKYGSEFADKFAFAARQKYKELYPPDLTGAPAGGKDIGERVKNYGEADKVFAILEGTERESERRTEELRKIQEEVADLRASLMFKLDENKRKELKSQLKNNIGKYRELENAVSFRRVRTRKALLESLYSDDVYFLEGTTTMPGNKARDALADGMDFVSKLVRWREGSPLPAVRVDTADNNAHEGRASYSLGESRINFSEKAPVSVMVHELGHFIEDQVPGVREAAFEFLKYRCGEEYDKPTSLNKKFPEVYKKKEGKPDEMGRKDKFELYWGEGSVSYYVGKAYDHATEIVSMGMEALYKDPAGFCEKDPEYARFMIGILTGALRSEVNLRLPVTVPPVKKSEGKKS